MHIHVNRPEEWFSSISEGFESPMIDNQINLNPKYGKGTLRAIPITEGLKVAIKSIELHQSCQIIKNRWENTDFQPVIFHYTDSGVEQKLGEQRFRLGRNTPKGIVIPSHQIKTQIILPAKVRITIVAVIFQRQWLDSYFKELLNTQNVEAQSPLKNLFFSQQPYFIYETISPQILRVLEDILQANYPLQLMKIYLQGKVLELFTLLFHKLLNRELSENIGNLNNTHIEGILAAERLMLSDLQHTPKIKEIARQVGMSESKLKKGFKEVFGESIYQYALQNRLDYAKTLLDSRRYNVGEVGTQIGYANLAHFAKAFRKHFNTSPSDYLHSLKR